MIRSVVDKRVSLTVILSILLRLFFVHSRDIVSELPSEHNEAHDWHIGHVNVRFFALIQTSGDCVLQAG